MKKVMGAFVALVLLSSSVTPASAGATPVGAYGSGILGTWIAGSVVGIAAFLGIYDLTRRLTCSGDFLNLGGPGFTTPITAGTSVLPPKCRTRRR